MLDQNKFSSVPLSFFRTSWFRDVGPSVIYGENERQPVGVWILTDKHSVPSSSPPTPSKLLIYLAGVGKCTILPVLQTWVNWPEPPFHYQWLCCASVLSGVWHLPVGWGFCRKFFAVRAFTCKQVLTSAWVCVHRRCIRSPGKYYGLILDHCLHLLVQFRRPALPHLQSLMGAVEQEVVLACRDRPGLCGLILVLHSLPSPKPHSGVLSSHASQLQRNSVWRNKNIAWFIPAVISSLVEKQHWNVSFYVLSWFH